MSIVLGIDLGTQSVKALFYDASIRSVVAEGSAELSLRQDEQGTAEQETNWWLDAVREALHAVDPSVRASVTAVGVSGQQHGLVVLHEGRSVAPVKLWCDTTTEVECNEIMDRFGGPERCLSEVGNVIPPGFTAAKIAWLKKHRPDDYARVDSILLPHDFLNFYLTGETAMEVGDASGTGFLDVRSRTWSEEMLRAIDPERDLTSCLPDLRQTNEAIGTVRSEAADELGLPIGIPVSVGGGDNMMAAIGTGNTRAGRLTISLGTSGTVFGYSDKPILDDRGEIAAFCSSTGGWLPLLCTMNCTVSTELVQGLFGASRDQFEAALSSSDVGAGGAITVPFFNGERTPNLPNAKACLFGLDSTNANGENLMRSAAEGATFAMRSGLQRLVDLGVEADTLVLTGGGSKSAAWRQMVADIMRKPVVVTHMTENAAFGAALQALEVVSPSTVTSVDDLVDEHVAFDDTQSCEPNDQAAEDYDTHFERYENAVSHVSAMYP